MSFQHPDVSEGFKALFQYLLWFQLFYSVWQFIRTTKYFRLPYVLFSSLWNGLDSWYKPRHLIIMSDDLRDDVLLYPVKNTIRPNGDRSPEGDWKLEDIDGIHCTMSFNDDMEHMYVMKKWKSIHMRVLRILFVEENFKFGVADDLLWPGGHLVRRLSFYKAMDHILAGIGYSSLSEPCFYDYSSNEVLDQNFITFVSILPLFLQARQFDFWSVMLSMAIILLDVFSLWSNKVWSFLQYWLSRIVKWVIAHLSNRQTRLFLHTFMSTISTQFECSNFVTQEASVKVMKKFPIVSNIRVNKRTKIQAFHPITSVYDRIEDTNELSLHDLRSSSVFVLGRLSNNEDAENLVGRPNVASLDEQNLIVAQGWTREDMAYFYGVVKLCEEANVSPIKTLDAHNAYCCTLKELVHGIKDRNFVVCEFKEEQKIFVS
ncbi:hypothetical protein O6H91_09G002500 [Diphasiastrum complanatum]|uniref:Uncharacterized protein n=1 Tax=Diphasiastrum complanatum TaxID=34168 RepID=A0ACC2CKX7_DIPCM|nr:hypothetical protein O6H91_09G002500 [Diphasiastrum complanatum]